MAYGIALIPGLTALPVARTALAVTFRCVADWDSLSEKAPNFIMLLVFAKALLHASAYIIIQKNMLLMFVKHDNTSRSITIFTSIWLVHG